MKVETVLSATTGGSEDRHQPGRLFVLPRAHPELVSSPFDLLVELVDLPESGRRLVEVVRPAPPNLDVSGSTKFSKY